MRKIAWAAPVSDHEAARRAGGRRGYNARRGLEQTFRRLKVARLWREGKKPGEIARELGVHPCTISRDLAAFFEVMRRERRCPCCGSTVGFVDYDDQGKETK